MNFITKTFSINIHILYSNNMLQSSEIIKGKTLSDFIERFGIFSFYCFDPGVSFNKLKKKRKNMYFRVLAFGFTYTGIRTKMVLHKTFVYLLQTRIYIILFYQTFFIEKYTEKEINSNCVCFISKSSQIFLDCVFFIFSLFKNKQILKIFLHILSKC